MNIKRLVFILPVLGLVLIFNSGCGTIMGTSITSEINPDFDVDGYIRYFINARNDELCYRPVFQVLRDRGIIPYNGDVNTSKLEIYVSNEEGICFPPRWNRHSPLWLRFTYPRKATVVFKDAVTETVLLEMKYKRAFFAINAGYKECRSMIKEELEKDLAKQQRKMLPVPLGPDTGSFSSD